MTKYMVNLQGAPRGARYGSETTGWLVHRQPSGSNDFAGKKDIVAAVTKLFAVNRSVFSMSRINDAASFTTGRTVHLKNSIQSIGSSLYRTCLNGAIYGYTLEPRNAETSLD